MGRKRKYGEAIYSHRQEPIACPFCGETDDVYTERCGAEHQRVTCLNCEAKGPQVLADAPHRTRALAINIWNRRSD